MHARIWRWWPRPGHYCGTCGLRWSSYWTRCIDEPGDEPDVVAAEPPAWSNEPTSLITYALTKAQWFRGNGGGRWPTD